MGDTGRVNKETPLRGMAGVISAGFGLAVGELLAGLVNRRSPVVAVGDRVVDGVPAAVKQAAISLFGTGDKVALVVGILVIVGLGALLAGVGAAASMRPPLLGVALFVVVGSLFASTGRRGTVSDAWPIIGAGAATLLALYVLVRRPARRTTETAADMTAADMTDLTDMTDDMTDDTRRGMRVDRRQFVTLGGGTALVSVAAAALGRRLQDNGEAAKVRSALTLPVPVKAPSAASGPAPRVGPASASSVNPAQVEVPGMTPFFVPNRDFYRIDTALVVPRIDVRTWSLTIEGMVDRPLKLTFDDLQKREIIEHDCTLMCVSNEIGGDLVGNARWLGVRLADLLREAGVKEGANQVFARSVDGFTAGFPTELALDGREAMLAFGMNGEPLPFAHGYPVRLVVPGIYGYVSAVKWLEHLKLTTFEEDEGYWIPRGWSALGPIKTSSRIDVPGRSSGQLRAGPQVIAGVAWAQHVGIELVEVQVDDGAWQTAALAADGGIDTWRQWKLPWEATAGVHSIRVRATDATGATQTEDRAAVAPDGATGWHTIQISILR